MIKGIDMNYSQVESPRWANAEQTEIFVLVNWEPVGYQDWARLIPTDPTENINKLLKEVLNGDHGPIGEYVPPTDAEIAEKLAMDASSIRGIRDYILTQEVDPIVSNPLRWADMTTSEQNAWSQYRTDLLNITDQSGFPHNVTWPTKPE